MSPASVRVPAFTGGLPTPQQQNTQSFHIPAPMGGINTASPASGMSAADCLFLYNMIPYQYGLRVRSGWYEYATNVGSDFVEDYGLYDYGAPLSMSMGAPIGGALAGGWPGALRAGVRSILSFAGSDSRGLKDRLFACTKVGIWDVTKKSASPSCVYTFEAQDLNSGKGVSTAFVNAAGDHYLAYCDGTNGYLVYSEKTDAWAKVIETPETAWATGKAYALGDFIVSNGLAYECTGAGTSQAAWLPATDYVVDDLVANGGNLYKCSHAGTSADSGGPTGTERSIADNKATWAYVSVAGPFGNDAAITDATCTWAYSPSVSGANPEAFRHVMSWKNRLWFCSNNSAKAYYLDVGQFAGQSYPINFGARFKYGGSLAGLWNWTVDGGQGIDDHLVGISTAGDVVIYTGTDPSSVATFGLKGVWWVGQVPPGRRLASSFGGDLFILSLTGCIPLSKLVAGYMIRDPNIYATGKIANLFNALMTERGSLEGWEINIHPTDNLLIINVPATTSKVQEQLTMSMATKGWSRHTGIPMSCMEQWRGKLYFGTFDNRVCVNDGYVDGMKLDGTLPASIAWGLMTSFQSLGSARKKRLHFAKPYFMTDGTRPGYMTQARWDFDLSEIGVTPAAANDPNSSRWDVGVWDVSKWNDGVDIAGGFDGATGMGTHVALILVGTSRTNTTLAGIDAAFDVGGIL